MNSIEKELEEWFAPCLIYGELICYEDLIRQLQEETQVKQLIKIIKRIKGQKDILKYLS